MTKIFGIPRPTIFWLIFSLLLGTSGYFMYQAYVGANDIVAKIYEPQNQVTNKVVHSLTEKDETALAVMAALELDTINVRHSRASSHLATRTWLRFMSSMFGAVCIVIGCGFVLGRISTDQASIDLEGGGIKAAFATTSPGLILAFIGSVLISIPLLANQEIRTNDKASFGYFLVTSNKGDALSVKLLPLISGTDEAPSKTLEDESLKEILNK